MKIIVFTDVHYFAADLGTAIFNTKKKLVRYALPMLDELTEKINNEYNADIAVNLGDSIQDTTTHDGDVAALSFIFERLKKIKCRCHSLLGNHDLKMMNSTEEAENILGFKPTCSLDMDGFHLIFLSTEARCELGTERGGCYKAQYLSDKDLEWLRWDLEKNDLPILVFTHFALAEDESVNDECMFMKNRGEVKALLKSSKKVKAVFSGHQHLTKKLSEDGIDYYLIDSMISADEKGDPSGAYLEIDAKNGDIKVTPRRIENKNVKH